MSSQTVEAPLGTGERERIEAAESLLRQLYSEKGPFAYNFYWYRAENDVMDDDRNVILPSFVRPDNLRRVTDPDVRLENYISEKILWIMRDLIERRERTRIIVSWGNGNDGVLISE